MNCEICGKPVSELSGPTGKALCNQHKYAEEPEALPFVSMNVRPMFVPCAVCGQPTGQRMPPEGEEAPVVYHPACEKGLQDKPNKAKTPAENK